MKALLLVVLVLAIATAACAGPEVRGAWITSWQSGFMTQKQVDDSIAALKKARLNALFIEVRKCADAYYDSKLEPRGPEVPAGFDPLAYTIEKAHADGIQVHAWVVVYRAWSGSRDPGPDQIVAKHPSWVMYDSRANDYAGEGIYLDPGVPEVREHLATVFADIAKRYKVDGIQYDYVRYPGTRWGYSQASMKRYYADTGAKELPWPNDPKFLQWRRDQVTALVKLAHDRIKAVNPKCQISASTICSGRAAKVWEETGPYSSVLQDWYLWMREGYIDINIPMNYRDDSSETRAKEFRDWIKLSEDWNGGRPVYQGIYSDIQAPEDVVKQIEATRQAGQEGFVLFSFNPGKDRDALAEYLGKTLTPAPRLIVNEPVSVTVTKEVTK